LQVHRVNVNMLEVFSSPNEPAGPRIAAASTASRSIEICNGNTGERVSTFECMERVHHLTSYWAHRPGDGDAEGRPRLAYVYSPDYPVLHDGDTGERVGECASDGVRNYVGTQFLHAYHDAEGRPRVVASEYKTVRTWEGDSGALLHVWQHAEPVSAAASFVPTPASAAPGARLVLGDSSGGLRVLDGETGEGLASYSEREPRRRIRGLACFEPSWAAPGTVHVASWGDGEEAKVWDVETARLVRRLGPHGGDKVTSLVAYREGEGRDRLATGAGDGHIRLWDGESGALLHTLPGNGSEILRLAAYEVPYSGAPRLISAAGARDGARLWDPEAGRLVGRLGFGGGAEEEAAQEERSNFICLQLFVTEEGRQRVALGDNRGRVVVWDLGEAAQGAPPGLLRGAHKV
jgi:WD40 repeat protein